jgi:hypothetical protein
MDNRSINEMIYDYKYVTFNYYCISNYICIFKEKILWEAEYLCKINNYIFLKIN